MPLPWLQSDLTGEGAYSELLDDLEDDDLHNVSSSGSGGNKSVDLFVPRKSVKKLVLKPKSPATPRYGVNIQSDTSGCSLGFVDLKTKVELHEFEFEKLSFSILSYLY